MLVMIKKTWDYVTVVKWKTGTYYYLNSKNKKKELKSDEITFIW